MTSESTTPAPEFRAQLEWEIARAVRREARLGTRHHDQRRRRIRAVTVVATCIALGTASSFASAQVRDQSRRDSLLEAARADLAMNNLRVDLVRSIVEETRKKIVAGIVSQYEFDQVQRELQGLENRSTRLKLDLSEIERARQSPRDELNAPLVDGRDYVKERIQLELQGAADRLSGAEQALRDKERLNQVGSETALTLAGARAELARARADLAMAAERLTLRREYLDKGTDAEVLARRLETTRIKQEIGVTQQTREMLRERVNALIRQRAVGSASELESLRAQVDLKELEQQIARLTAQLKRIAAGEEH